MEPSQDPKKPSKKDLDKAKRLRRRREAAAAAAAASSAVTLADDTPDPLSSHYGDIPYTDLQSPSTAQPRVWTPVKELGKKIGEWVLVRGRVDVTRKVSKNRAFLIVKENNFKFQCVLSVSEGFVSAQMVKFAAGVSDESIVDVEGVVSVPEKPITGTSLQVEIQVRKIHCVNRADPLPFSIEDAARSEAEIQSALECGEQLVRVNQDTRLDYRHLDLRTPANQAIFTIDSEVLHFFCKFFRKSGFRQIRTPSLIAGSSEGGAAVFKLEYFNQPACLAQSPQFHKQMAICGGFQRVFTAGPVFRAESSRTHRHLCEFTGLDVEMEIKDHYSEVMDIVGSFFVEMFNKLNEECQEELADIRKQYPFKPLKYLKKTLVLTFEQGIQMLNEVGVEVDPFGDLNTETERALGKLVLEKHDTDFYILHRFPLAVRPFYTMPCADNSGYSNSFDVFIRGEEIISGAQRVHSAALLESRAQECGVKTESTYINSFRHGTPPHGGFGVGLERVVMLFCALDNIRKTSLFPRDPKRLEP